jgi:hypothetical protein
LAAYGGHNRTRRGTLSPWASNWSRREAPADAKAPIHDDTVIDPDSNVIRLGSR